MSVQSYFKALSEEVAMCYGIASSARAKGFDPDTKVEVHLARDMAERVEGLVGSVAPQIVGSGMTARIKELEKQYGEQDWRVALVIAAEVAKQSFCKFADEREAMEVGIRVGFAYHTVGVVAAPLEGFIELAIKQRRDGKAYLAAKYAGPVRGAGGTAAAVSVVIADYVGRQMGYAQYDPDDKETERMITELTDYHERVTNLQYKPSDDEIRYLVQHLPVEVDGDPTEQREVSNYKDLPRVATNRIRGGVCLVVSMIALKAPKLRTNMLSWGKDMGMDWSWLTDFEKIQKKAKAGKSAGKGGMLPDFTYIADLPAGRPVLGYPLRAGGFRLRYGRSRLSGFSAVGIHPATLQVLNDFIAVGTQLKTERPGKAASVTPCDSIEGPVVRLQDGSVLHLQDEAEAKRVAASVTDILFLGDMLISYGDFFDRGHPLIPAGYCEEWWFAELKGKAKQGDGLQAVAKALSCEERELRALGATIKNLDFNVSLALAASRWLGVLHPRMTHWWKLLDEPAWKALLEGLRKAKDAKEAINNEFSDIIVPYGSAFKAACEKARLPHKVQLNEFVIFSGADAAALRLLFLSPKGVLLDAQSLAQDPLAALSHTVQVRDKTGTFIGARMGRPEKAKMRRMTGSPHGLFPVGKEGGKMRSLQASLEKGAVTADFRAYLRDDGSASFFPGDGKPAMWCNTCGKVVLESCNLGCDLATHYRSSVPITEHFKQSLERLGMSSFPDLIKGVRGTMNADHEVEHVMKSILRAKHKVYVNKDGTTRYDMTELPITHFTPKEVGTSVARLRELGYTEDMDGTSLEHETQVLDLLPQDVILPVNTDTADCADEVLINIAGFIDDLLERMYGLEPYYNIKTREDLVGHLVIGLAPHISAGIIGRIVGFSGTQGCLAHPLWHAAQRRDCDGDENCILLLLDGLINFSRKFLPDRRGSRTMDAPLVLTDILVPSEVDDMVHKLDIAGEYPLELWQKGLLLESPKKVKVAQLGDFLGTDRQYIGMRYTNTVTSVNAGVLCSSYKTLPSMEDKLKGQMGLAEKLWSVEASDVARLVIDKHFMKDIIGNLRQFSMQKFRCVDCNEKYRRPPLAGKCKCGGKLLFTVTEGTVIKYLIPSISLAQKYNLPPYSQQRLEIVRERVESMFGRSRDKQEALGRWFG